MLDKLKGMSKIQIEKKKMKMVCMGKLLCASAAEKKMLKCDRNQLKSPSLSSL